MWVIFSNVSSHGFQSTLDIPGGLGPWKCPGNDDLTDRTRNRRGAKHVDMAHQIPLKQRAKAKRPKGSSGIIKLNNTKL